MTGADTGGQLSPSSPAGRSMWRLRAYGLAVVGGAVFGLLVLLIVLRSRGTNLPPITEREFEAARRRWDASGLLDYEIEVTVSGRQAAVYSVTVRGGDVVRSTRNGERLRQQRTLGTWSVPGMFHTIAIDMGNVRRFQSGVRDAGAVQLALRGTFDPEYGYPARYHRTEKRRSAPNVDVSWVVTRFDVSSSEELR